MTITLVASVFTRRGSDGDFAWMIEQPRWKDALFIFNDNEQQSKAFLDHVSAGVVDPASGGCQDGGGNAVIRHHQCAAPPRAAGVPTGPGYESLTPHARSRIERAIAWIAVLLGTGRYASVIYSSSPADSRVLGHGIFSVGDDVLGYIPARLEEIVAGANAG